MQSLFNGAWLENYQEARDDAQHIVSANMLGRQRAGCTAVQQV